MTSSYARFRPHPWHGVSPGEHCPDWVTVFVEITPFDTIKYELDKETGFLRVDRPQSTSALPPTVYGFVPQTYAAERVAALMPDAERGDGDPLDICVLAERPVGRSEVLLTARLIGGLPMCDGGEADDKLIAVLKGDAVWGEVTDLAQLSPALIERMRHYFLTYKSDGQSSPVSIGEAYGRAHAQRVLEASLADYQHHFRQA